MGKVLAVNLGSSLRNNTSLNEFMSKGKSEQLKPQYEKTDDKGYGCNAWVVRQSNQKSLNQVTATN